VLPKELIRGVGIIFSSSSVSNLFSKSLRLHRVFSRTKCFIAFLQERRKDKKQQHTKKDQINTNKSDLFAVFAPAATWIFLFRDASNNVERV